MCKSSLTSLVMIMALLFCCPTVAEAGQNSAATVHLDLDTAVGGIQTTCSAAVDDVFDVDIVINGAVNLTTFNLVVTFPQAVLEIQDAGVTEGDFLNKNGVTTTFLKDTATGGRVEVTGIVLGTITDEQAADGDGVLAHLRFKVLSTLQADLAFSAAGSDTQLLRDNAGDTDDPVALGNASGGTVNPGAGTVSADQSTVDATTPVDADGTSTTTITITAKDAFGTPLQGIPDANIVVASTGTGNTITQPTTATDAAGQTTATMSSTVPETKTISVTINGVAITDTASVVFEPPDPSAAQSTVEATTPVVADGTSTTTITITANDASGTPIPGIAPGDVVVAATGAGNTITQPTAATDASGQTTATMSSTVAETKTVSVTISGIAITDTASVLFEPGPVSADQSTVEATTPVAASVEPSGPKSTITITAKDAQGNAIPGIAPGEVVVSSTGTGNTITQPTAATDASGQTTATMSSSVAETKTVSVSISGAAITNTAPVEFTGEPALTIEKSDDADPVDPNTEVTYTITYGNAGLADAHNTVIVETLPADLSYVSATGGGDYDDTARTITWTIGTQEAAAIDDTVTFTARVANSGSIFEGGTITNSDLTIDCDETDPVGQISPETTDVNDAKAPETSGHIPDANSVQAARDTIVQLHITDGGSGVAYDGGTVTIHVEGDLIYDGANETSPGVYDSNSVNPGQAVKGICQRAGTEADYTFVFQPSTPFDYEQRVDVTVNATDHAGNVMPEETYHFFTVMRSFGANARVNSDTGGLDQDNPATLTDSYGNIWVVWDQTNTTGDTGIYAGILPDGASAFEASVPVADSANNERQPAIAIDVNDVVYVAWQEDDPNGHWDVFVSSSADGTSWSAPVKVNLDDPNNDSDQTSPVIAISAGADTLYVACEDNRAGNYDIWVATSADGTTWTPTRITTDANDQTEPAIVINHNVACIGWTDARNASTDLYSAASEYAWAIDPAVITASNQSSAALAADPCEVVHDLWVDDANGYDDIFYGMGDLPLTGTSIIDEPNTVQSDPTIAVRGMDGSVKVFAAWTDGRSVSGNNDTDIYFAESGSPFGTNILVNDDLGTAPQTKPAIGVDKDGNPYIVWADDRNRDRDIYYAGATAIGPPGGSGTVTASDPNTQYVQINEDSNDVDDANDVVIEIPAGALNADATITIAELLNPPTVPPGGFGVCYDFGPSGLQFNVPVTITIPHHEDDCPGLRIYKVYWYNDQTGTWSQDGISDVQHLTQSDDPNLPSDVHVVRFKAEHFTSFGVGASPAYYDDDDGGTCAISRQGQGDPVEFLLPFVAYIVVLASISWVDRHRRKARQDHRN